MKNILIVDDDSEYRENLKEILDNAGYPNDMAESVKIALEKLGTQHFDIILLDFMMPEIDGINALGEIKKISPYSKIIMITAFASIENAVRAIKKGACQYISKPFKIEALLLMIKQVTEELRFEKNIKKIKTGRNPQLLVQFYSQGNHPHVSCKKKNTYDGNCPQAGY